MCNNVKELRADIWVLRQAVAEAAAEHGMAPIATSTHPFARWLSQQYTEAERYRALTADLQAVTRQLLISGMHVHVGIEDPDLRIDLMDQVAYFLPHLLALSTLVAVLGGTRHRPQVLPPDGGRGSAPAPGSRRSSAHGRTSSATWTCWWGPGSSRTPPMVWWHIRPSERYPTVEMRVTDLPARMEDTIALAAMYVCLLRMLWRLRLENRRWRSYANFLLSENLWRAARYGISGELMDFGRGVLVPFGDLLEELIEMVIARRRGPGLRDGDRAHPHDLPARHLRGPPARGVQRGARRGRQRGRGPQGGRRRADRRHAGAPRDLAPSRRVHVTRGGANVGPVPTMS